MVSCFLVIYIFYCTIAGTFIWVFQYIPVQDFRNQYIESLDQFDLDALPIIPATLNVASDFSNAVTAHALTSEVANAYEERNTDSALLLLGGLGAPD